MIKGIGHVAFKVTDMEKSLHFYCDILGGKKAFSMDRDGKPWIQYVALADGVFIELFYDGTPRTEKNDDEHLTGFLHTCIEVDDIYEIAEQIKKNGGAMFVEPMKGCDNNYQAWVIDPDGNRIEFMKLEPDSPQSLYRF